MADGPTGQHGAAEIFSGAALMESEEVGVVMDTRVGDNGSLHDEFLAPSDEDKGILRRVPGSIPWISYVLCVAELAERASYYGASTVFNNFMEFPLPEGGDGSGAVPRDHPNGHAGAL